MAVNEAKVQHLNLMNELSGKTSRILDAIGNLAESLGANLAEIEWVLANIDDKLGRILKVLRAPLGTKAHELVVDGNLALSRGFITQAKGCFEEALEHKPSDYWALTSLGFALVRLEEPVKAIKAFEDAAAFVPSELGAEGRVTALENLARSHYADSNFKMAFQLANQAAALRSEHKCLDAQSLYLLSVYCYLINDFEYGSKLMAIICKEHPDYFLTYTTDEDLNPFRVQVLETLNDLARMANNEARQLSDNLETVFKGVLPEIQIIQKNGFCEELQLFQKYHDINLGLIRSNNYSDSIKSTNITAHLLDIGKRIPKVVTLMKDFAAAEKARMKTEKELRKLESNILKIAKKKERISSMIFGIFITIGCIIAVVLLIWGIQIRWRLIGEEWNTPWSQVFLLWPLNFLLKILAIFAVLGWILAYPAAAFLIGALLPVSLITLLEHTLFQSKYYRESSTENARMRHLAEVDNCNTFKLRVAGLKKEISDVYVELNDICPIN